MWVGIASEGWLIVVCIQSINYNLNVNKVK
jgi:hypothetical protein